MSLRSKVLLVLVVILVILLAIWLYFWLQNNNTIVNTNVNKPLVLNNTPITNIPIDTTIPKPIDNTLSARVLALNFAERYGTYSNDLPYENLHNLTGILTPSFQARINSIIQANAKQEGFYSITTKALVAKVNSQTDNTAQLTISTQRQELFTRNGEIKVSYATLSVSLNKSGENWLVDSAAWEKE